MQLGLVLLVLAGLRPNSEPNSEPDLVVRREVPMMGTMVRLEVAAPSRTIALEASEVGLASLAASELRLSTWSAGGELARLNDQPVASPFALSPQLEAELTAARACWEATAGAFDPGVGSLVEAWGLRSGGRVPTDDEVARALVTTGLRWLELDQGRATWLRAGVRLDEGAFGKGAAADQALVAMREAVPDANIVLDLGGQVAVAGRPATVLVADPRDRSRAVLELTGVNGAVATSGNSERGLVVDGTRFGHIFDPRNGRPAVDFGSLTVVAPTGFLADCLSTGLYVLGADAAFGWAARHPEVGLVVLDPTATTARVSAALLPRVRVVAPGVVVVAEVPAKPALVNSPSEQP